jgi:hypothetical protein
LSIQTGLQKEDDIAIDLRLSFRMCHNKGPRKQEGTEIERKKDFSLGSMLMILGLIVWANICVP